MPKRYRLKLDHPYARAGTIVEEVRTINGTVYVVTPGNAHIEFPLSVVEDWLEEVKEELQYSKEFAEAVKTFAKEIWMEPRGHKRLFEYLDAHTSKE